MILSTPTAVATTVGTSTKRIWKTCLPAENSGMRACRRAHVGFPPDGPAGSSERKMTINQITTPNNGLKKKILFRLSIDGWRRHFITSTGTALVVSKNQPQQLQ